MLRKVWAVIRREFTTRVYSRWFVASTILVPMLLFGTLLVPLWAGGRRSDGRRVPRVVLVDETGTAAGPSLVRRIASSGRWVALSAEAGEGVVDSLTGQVELGLVDGFLVLERGSIAAGEVTYYGSNVASLGEMHDLESMVQATVSSTRLRLGGVDPALVASTEEGIDFKVVALAGGSAGGLAEGAIVLAYLVAFTLYIALFVYGQSVLRSVIEEKTTRMVEVLSSSMRPEVLMGGKIIGVGAVGLFQLSIWVACGVSAYQLRARLAGLLGVRGSVEVAIPGIDVGAVVVSVAYFMVGFFLFSTLYAAAGALVTSEQEAQQAQMPVTLLLVPGILVFPAVLDDPNAGLAGIMSIIPFSSPIIMPARWVLGDVGPGQLAASIVILALTTLVLVILAGRVYRTGVLMYGKRPTLAEVARWVVR